MSGDGGGYLSAGVGRMKWVLIVGFLAVLGLGYVLYDYLTVDSCLDAGGKWDSDRMACIK